MNDNDYIYSIEEFNISNIHPLLNKALSSGDDELNILEQVFNENNSFNILA